MSLYVPRNECSPCALSVCICASFYFAFFLFLILYCCCLFWCITLSIVSRCFVCDLTLFGGRGGSVIADVDCWVENISFTASFHCITGLSWLLFSITEARNLSVSVLVTAADCLTDLSSVASLKICLQLVPWEN